MVFILVSNIMRARRWRKTGQINFPKERYSGGGYEVANVTQEALDYKRGIISSPAVKRQMSIEHAWNGNDQNHLKSWELFLFVQLSENSTES